jgi:hypothetical protein
MSKYDHSLAVGVVGLAGFQLLQAWNANAPSLAEIRDAPPGDLATKQKLVDADIMVGGVVAVLGVTFAVLTHDTTALIIMGVLFGSLAAWYHAVLAAENIT